MSYNQNIPQATDRIKDSQPELLANFQAIRTLVGVNHVNFDDPSGNQGKHAWVEFPNMNFTPPVVSGEVTLYGAINSVTSVRELAIINSAGNTVYATASLLSLNATPPTGQGMWTYVPSGILFKSGIYTAASSGLNTVTLSTTTIPPFNIANAGILTVLLTPVDPSTTNPNNTVRLVNIVDYRTFRIFVSAPGNYQFLAIGY